MWHLLTIFWRLVQVITFFFTGVGYLFVEKPMMNVEVLITSRVRTAAGFAFCTSSTSSVPESVITQEDDHDYSMGAGLIQWITTASYYKIYSDTGTTLDDGNLVLQGATESESTLIAIIRLLMVGLCSSESSLYHSFVCKIISGWYGLSMAIGLCLWES